MNRNEEKYIFRSSRKYAHTEKKSKNNKKTAHILYIFWNFWPSCLCAALYRGVELGTHSQRLVAFRSWHFPCALFAIEIEWVDENKIKRRAQKAILCASGRNLMCFQLSTFSSVFSAILESMNIMWGWSSTRRNFIFFCRAAEERDERWRRHTNQPNFQWQPRKKWNVFLRNYAMCTLNFSHSSDVERFILSLIFFSKSFCLGFHCLHTIIMPSSCDYATYYLHWNENERGEKGELRTSSKISYKAGRNFGRNWSGLGKSRTSFRILDEC